MMTDSGFLIYLCIYLKLVMLICSPDNLLPFLNILKLLVIGKSDLKNFTFKDRYFLFEPCKKVSILLECSFYAHVIYIIVRL